MYCSAYRLLRRLTGRRHTAAAGGASAPATPAARRASRFSDVALIVKRTRSPFAV